MEVVLFYGCVKMVDLIIKECKGGVVVKLIVESVLECIEDDCDSLLYYFFSAYFGMIIVFVNVILCLCWVVVFLKIFCVFVEGFYVGM